MKKWTKRRVSHPTPIARIAFFDLLEQRTFLSAASHSHHHSMLRATPTLAIYHSPSSPRTSFGSAGKVSPAMSASPIGLTPGQVRKAYGMDLVSFAGIQGNGAGQTIAIVDAYDSPTAFHDLQQFDKAFGLPDPPSFKRVAQDGSTNFPATDPAGAGNPNGTWELEEALDIEWAHAMAPAANILLVEANNSSLTNLVQGAVNWARSQPGVVAVSMSFGGGEFFGETSLDSIFTTPGGHGG